MVKAMVLVCMVAGCGRLGFGLDDDDDSGRDAGASDASTSDAVDATADGATTAAAYAQQSATADNVGDLSFVLPAPSAAGSLLVVTLGTSDTSSLGMPAGWTIAAQANVTGGCYAAIAYYPNNPGGITTVTFTLPALIPTVAVLSEWTGASALDALGTATGASPATAFSVQTATPTTVAGGVAIDVFCEAVNVPTFTTGSGWMNLGTASNGPSEASFTTNYRPDLAAGMTIGETVTTTVAGKYAAVVATFRP